MKQPLISVIIANYNYGHYLKEALDSVFNQTFSNIEIIVVDDGSTDNSKEILTKYSERIKLIYQENKGVGAARNVGVKNSSGKFISFLDSDDMWLPTKLERQLEAMLEDEKTGLVTCGMREFDTKTNEILKIHLEGQSGWCADKLLSFEPVVGPTSTLLIKRHLFDEVGGFDERKEMHPAEDWEFCYQIARIGKIAFIPEIFVEYRNHGNNGHLNIPRMEQALFMAYNKIFDTSNPEIEKMRNKCFGKVHSILAGSYFQSGNYSSFINHTAKSIWYKPSSIFRYLEFPFRKIKQRIKPPQNAGI